MRGVKAFSRFPALNFSSLGFIQESVGLLEAGVRPWLPPILRQNNNQLFYRLWNDIYLKTLITCPEERYDISSLIAPLRQLLDQFGTQARFCRICNISYVVQKYLIK